MKDYRRLLVTSDQHGCLEEFDELLQKIQYNKETDRLILAGDYIDRGPDSLGLIRRIRELNLPQSDILMGNHEYFFLRWFKGNNHLTERSHYKQFSDEDITFINNMPYYLTIPEHNLLVVHAGIKPGISIDKQDKKDLLYLRYTDEARKTVSIKKVLQRTQPPDTKFWTEFGPFGTNVIFGHNVWLNDVRIDKFDDGYSCFGIDGGCVFGGTLNCLIWETKEIVQVKAKQIYYTNDLSKE